MQTKDDPISRLNTNGKTIPDEIEDIKTLFIDQDNHEEDNFVDLLHEEDDLNAFMEPEYTEGYKIITIMDDPTQLTYNFEQVSSEKPITRQRTTRRR